MASAGLRALVVGGTGQTGPLVVKGLLDRGYDVTVLHGGQHEHPEMPPVPHIHKDPHFLETLQVGLAGQNFDLAIAMYGRTRLVAEALVGKVGRLIAISGTAHSIFDRNDDRWGRLGRISIDENSPFALSKDVDPLSFAVWRTEQELLAHHSAHHMSVTIIRFPEVFGPYSTLGFDWSIIRRIMDRRPQFVIADGGLRLRGRIYRDNAAHAVLLTVDRPETTSGEVITVADSSTGITEGQIVTFYARVLGHEFELVSMPSFLVKTVSQALGGYHKVYQTRKAVERLGFTDAVDPVTALEATARWWADHPPERNGELEQSLGDPFDYRTEDDLITAYKEAVERLARGRRPASPLAHPYRHPRQVNDPWSKDRGERIFAARGDDAPFRVWLPTPEEDAGRT